MDEFLSELYGTNEIIGEDDLEKSAATEFLVKLAEEEGVDLDTLSDDEISNLIGEIEGGMGKEAAEAATETEPEVDEAQEKLAEADFLGRAMAHAYVNELSEIEKEAGKASEGFRAVKKALKHGADTVAGAGRVAGEWTGASQMGRGAKKALVGLRAHGKEGRRIKRDFGETGLKTMQGTTSAATKEGLKEMGAGAARMGKRVVAPAAVVGGAYGVGRATGKSQEKNSFDNEFEAAAAERAYEMLAEAGYDVEKVAQQDVDTMALQMLEQAGYEVNWS